MLIRIAALVLKNDVDEKLKLLTNLKELLNSKDIKSALQNHLTTCMLSPNITAYVTHTHTQILKFIKEHQEVFKVPESLFEDVQLSTLFAKIVSNSLSTIHGNMKSKLTGSIAKCISITDITRSLTHGCIEVDAAHWNRLTFLRCCLCVYLIGIGDYKIVSLKSLYSPLLIPSLPKEICEKIGPQLGIDIDKIEQSMLASEEDGDSTGPFPDITADEDEAGNSHGENKNIDVDVDYNRDNTDFEPDAGNPGDVDRDGLVVEEKGKPESDLYTEQAMQDKGSSYEKAYSNILLQYLQQDLSNFPGNTKVPALLSTNCPQWQLTIQNHLLWNHV
ncbi:hypothetical protein EDB19DRAFT_1916269 [Suillus lakei]|nr:hypothetical protein EDB19DRAFT_1916269 [Suillus lakei]